MRTGKGNKSLDCDLKYDPAMIVQSFHTKWYGSTHTTDEPAEPAFKPFTLQAFSATDMEHTGLRTNGFKPHCYDTSQLVVHGLWNVDFQNQRGS